MKNGSASSSASRSSLSSMECSSTSLPRARSPRERYAQWLPVGGKRKRFFPRVFEGNDVFRLRRRRI
eukprot:11224954-Lingulodinium_polyedra.AAC.1